MTVALSVPVPSEAQADFCQLRHQTRNALARILAQLSAGLAVTDASRRVAADLERRILLTSQISDALFGLTRAPGPFGQRFGDLCAGILDLASEPDQHLTLRCSVAGEVPAAHQETVLRIAHEFVGNAVKHGMHMRLIGRIDVDVSAGLRGVTLEVTDDGWGCGRDPAFGEGMRLAALLATRGDGQVTLERRGEHTVARLVIGAVRRG